MNIRPKEENHSDNHHSVLRACTVYTLMSAFRIFTYMNDLVKEALRAEKAMNEALKEEKAKPKKQRLTPKVTVVADKI